MLSLFPEQSNYHEVTESYEDRKSTCEQFVYLYQWARTQGGSRDSLSHEGRNFVTTTGGGVEHFLCMSLYVLNWNPWSPHCSLEQGAHSA